MEQLPEKIDTLEQDFDRKPADSILEVSIRANEKIKELLMKNFGLSSQKAETFL